MEREEKEHVKKAMSKTGVETIERRLEEQRGPPQRSKERERMGMPCSTAFPGMQACQGLNLPRLHRGCLSCYLSAPPPATEACR